MEVRGNTPITAAQLLILKADIEADPVFSSLPNTSDAAFQIAAGYNQDAAPLFVVWRTIMMTKDILDNLEWTTFIARTRAEQDAFQFMMRNGEINPSRPNVRQGLQDIFSGPGGVTQRASLLAAATRNATRAEKLFATGLGTDASPGTLSFEGLLDRSNVLEARSL